MTRDRELVAHLTRAAGRGAVGRAHHQDFPPAARAHDLEGDARGDGPEPGGERVERGGHVGGARGEVVERAERAERHGDADLGGQLLPRRPAERLPPDALERFRGEDAVQRRQRGLRDAGRLADALGVEPCPAESGEEDPRGGGGHQGHGGTIAERARPR
jgi:hypothetical protein